MYIINKMNNSPADILLAHYIDNLTVLQWCGAAAGGSPGSPKFILVKRVAFSAVLNM
jgi:hypothetical protein